MVAVPTPIGRDFEGDGTGCRKNLCGGYAKEAPADTARRPEGGEFFRDSQGQEQFQIESDNREGPETEKTEPRSLSRSKGQWIQPSLPSSARGFLSLSGKGKAKPARRPTRTRHFPPPAYPETEQIIRTRSDCPEMPSFA